MGSGIGGMSVGSVGPQIRLGEEGAACSDRDQSLIADSNTLKFGLQRRQEFNGEQGHSRSPFVLRE